MLNKIYFASLIWKFAFSLLAAKIFFFFFFLVKLTEAGFAVCLWNFFP